MQYQITGCRLTNRHNASQCSHFVYPIRRYTLTRCRLTNRRDRPKPQRASCSDDAEIDLKMSPRGPFYPSHLSRRTYPSAKPRVTVRIFLSACVAECRRASRVGFVCRSADAHRCAIDRGADQSSGDWRTAELRELAPAQALADPCRPDGGAEIGTRDILERRTAEHRVGWRRKSEADVCIADV